MTTMIQGKKYSFEIISQREGRDYRFFVRAKSKSLGRTSCINNLNMILSEFGIGGNDPKVADSTWVVARKEALYFVYIAKQFISDPLFLNHLERQLDEDRRLGEWENVA